MRPSARAGKRLGGTSSPDGSNPLPFFCIFFFFIFLNDHPLRLHSRGSGSDLEMFFLMETNTFQIDVDQLRISVRKMRRGVTANSIVSFLLFRRFLLSKEILIDRVLTCLFIFLWFFVVVDVIFIWSETREEGRHDPVETVGAAGGLRRVLPGFRGDERRPGGLGRRGRLHQNGCGTDFFTPQTQTQVSLRFLPLKYG